MPLENRMILKKSKSKLFCCARKKVKVFLPTPIFRLVMTNLHRRVTVGERTSYSAISSLPAHGVRLGNSRPCGPTFKPDLKFVATGGHVKFLSAVQMFQKTYFASLHTSKCKLSSQLLENLHIMFNFNQKRAKLLIMMPFRCLLLAKIAWI